MKVWIDQDLCTGDGLCEEICPSVFTLLDDGLAYVKEGDDVKNAPGGAEGWPSSPPSWKTRSPRPPKSAPASAPHHQPGNEHGQQDMHHYAVQTCPDPAEHNATEHEIPQRRQTRQRHETVVHRVDRAAGGSRRGHGPQHAVHHAEPLSPCLPAAAVCCPRPGWAASPPTMPTRSCPPATPASRQTTPRRVGDHRPAGQTRKPATPRR